MRTINSSLTSEHFPNDWKEALVTPLLKLPGLFADFTNLHPISNLQYVSQLMECVVFEQTHAHMAKDGSTVPHLGIAPTIMHSYAAPVLWNSLPLNTRTSSSLSIFKQRLKTFHFKNALICE